ncbi:MAG: hypothetical protein ACFB50_09160 [Rubrobacteraceae bacterium]
MSVLIPTHALPVLSYGIPGHLVEEVDTGSAVVVPLSGYSRLGVVVEVKERGEDSREHLRGVIGSFSVPPGLVEVCQKLSESFVIPLPNILRAALPPGLNAGSYRIVEPDPGWPWKAGGLVGRTTLRRALGSRGLQAAENEGRLKFAASLPEPRLTEWAVVRAGPEPDLSRAPRQRSVFERLIEHGNECPTLKLLSEAQASRSALKELERRGAVRLERRAERPPLHTTRGHREPGDAREDYRGYLRDAGRAVDRGGAWFWRVPRDEQASAVTAFSAAALEGGEQVLILVPEVESVEWLVKHLVDLLPRGYTVAPYHGYLDKQRALLHEKARAGELDVLVGTRTAALIPLANPGALCVVDEPNTSHRAGPGYEGLPVHVREIALERSRTEGCSVLFVSPTPSLRISAPGSNVLELPARKEQHWPAVRIVDTRGSGATLSSALVGVGREGLREGKRLAVLSNRLGYATSISCNLCGAVQSCPDCDLPLVPQEALGSSICNNCGHVAGYNSRCEICGHGRLTPTGLATDRLREELSRTLDVPVGKLTAGIRELEDAPIVVATAHFVVGGHWDVVLVPDADTLLLGGRMGSVERAFRVLYGAAAAAKDLILVQTRSPESYALRAALGGDYPSFAAAELPRLRASGYPPYGHLAVVELEGAEENARRAVELQVRPSLEPGVSMSELVPAAWPEKRPTWRVLLRATDPGSIARSAARALRGATTTRNARGLKARVEIDPEEV